MRRLTLTEFTTLPNVELSVNERDDLKRIHPGIRIEPSPGSEDHYDVTPDQRVGIVGLPDLVIEIRPKVPISSVLFILSYACGAVTWFDEQQEFTLEVDLAEMLATMLARMAQHATRRGLINGYQTQEEALQAPRGRIRFDEQIRRHMGVSPPIEVSHDVFTPDVIENQLILAALIEVSRIPFRSPSTQREILRAQRLFGAVSRRRFEPRAVPDVLLTILNRHYQAALALAALILRSSSLDLGAGGAKGYAFLIDMNKAFEQFVRMALRDALGADAISFPERSPHRWLDEDKVVRLKPDLCVLVGDRITWVGDAKYKRLPVGAFVNADLYQLLAYAIALDLPGGTLIYAADRGVKSAEHVVVEAGKRLRVVALDLTAPRTSILRQIGSIAMAVRRQSMRESAFPPPLIGVPDRTMR